jgi:hypothetical protein
MDIKSKIEAGLKALCMNESYIISNDTNERTLTFHLARYLEEYFTGYSIDCEYNRNGNVPKRLIEPTTTVAVDDLSGKTVFPDIVIHKRGVPPEGENYIIIEAKKEGIDYEDDIEKLKLYKNQLGYEYSFMVIIPRNFDETTDDITDYVISIE